MRRADRFALAACVLLAVASPRALRAYGVARWPADAAFTAYWESNGPIGSLGRRRQWGHPYPAALPPGVQPGGIDPWGRPFVVVASDVSDGVFHPLSQGPDGLTGTRDDVGILGSGEPTRAWALRQAHALAGFLAITLAGAWVSARTLRQRRAPSLGREARRAALHAAPLLPLCGLLLASGALEIRALKPLAQLLVVPLPLAVTGTLWVAAWLAILRLRAKRPVRA